VKFEKFGICDGSCLRNPGPGGWAFAIVEGDKIDIQSGSVPNTTNNAMELTALLKLLLNNQVRNIYTDSNYVCEGVKTWRFGWIKNNWINSQKQQVKNLELWKSICEIPHLDECKINWIKGHEKASKGELYRIQGLVDEAAREAAGSCDN
jgi:ribonuclease HI